jgi:hypothetical protein
LISEQVAIDARFATIKFSPIPPTNARISMTFPINDTAPVERLNFNNVESKALVFWRFPWPGDIRFRQVHFMCQIKL